MRIEIVTPESITGSAEVMVRALLMNDSYEPVAVSRNAFVGPTVTGAHQMASVEPTYGQPEEPLVLQPFTFYGRERSLAFPPGESEVVATYRDGDDGEEISSTVRVVAEP
jgi:hypothetical protein